MLLIISIETLGQTTYTWTAGNFDNDWLEPTNWSPNGVPSYSDHVIITNQTYDPLVDGTITIGSMEITSGGFVDFSSGALLQIRGDLTDNYNSGYTNWDATEGAVSFTGWTDSDIDGEFNFYEMHVDKEPTYNLDVNLVSGTYVLINNSLLLKRSGNLNTNHPSSQLMLNSVYDAGGPGWETAYINFYATASNEADIVGDLTMMQSFPGNYKTYHYFSSPVCSSGTLYNNAQFAYYTDQTDSWMSAWTWYPNPSYIPDYIYYYEPEEDPNTPGNNMQYGWQGLNPLTSSIYDVERGQGVCARFKPYYSGSQCTPISFVGTPNRGSFDSPPMDVTNNSETADGYNLMGNPYCAPIDWNMVYLDNSSLPLIAAWQNDGNEYTGEYWWYDADIPYGDYDWDGKIAIAQGFFVVADYDGQEIDFEPRHCVYETRPTVHRKIKPENLACIQIVGQNKRDELVIHFKDSYSKNFVKGEDRSTSLKNAVSITTVHQGIEAKIEKRPLPQNQEVIPLIIQIPESGYYEIKSGTYSLDETKVNIFLEDRELKTFIRLTETSQYGFNANDTKLEGRFFLHFTSPNSTIESNDLYRYQNQAWFNGNNLILNLDPETLGNFEVKLFDVSGRETFHSSVNSGLKILDCSSLNGGIYQLQIIDKGNIQSIKLVKPF